MDIDAVFSPSWELLGERELALCPPAVHLCHADAEEAPGPALDQRGLRPPGWHAFRWQILVRSCSRSGPAVRARPFGPEGPSWNKGGRNDPDVLLLVTLAKYRKALTNKTDVLFS